jgi:hypothetical protein
MPIPEVCNNLELRGSRQNNSWCSCLLLLLLLCPHKLHLLLLLLPHPRCWPLLLLSRERLKATIVRRRLEDLNGGGGGDGLKVYRRRWRGCERCCGGQLLRTRGDALKG